MAIEPRALIVVAGLPGSGKSTLLRSIESDTPLVMLDSDRTRDRFAALLPAGTPYSYYRPAVHLVHRLAVSAVILRRRGAVVVHDPATGVPTRAWLVSLGVLSRRPRHFLWVDCPPADAAAGQRARGRVVRKGSFARHLRRLPRMRATLRTGPRGWHTTTVVDRDTAAAGLELTFRTAASNPD
ncbi:putative kinase [Prauserella sediminis]|uniref:Putative kinase n=1 Tax=Prauserella sediminis TaxID=577680 RepID=A0A839XM31_9PSEU|nr:AAA family ATPase [Prauserella sediminis]MBB3662584.1 putative kinase [Prauserella sediminis]